MIDSIALVAKFKLYGLDLLKLCNVADCSVDVTRI